MNFASMEEKSQREREREEVGLWELNKKESVEHPNLYSSFYEMAVM